MPHRGHHHPSVTAHRIPEASTFAAATPPDCSAGDTSVAAGANVLQPLPTAILAMTVACQQNTYQPFLHHLHCIKAEKHAVV